MRVKQVDLFLPLDEAASDADLVARVAAILAVRVEDIARMNVLRRSLDARRGRPIGWQLLVEAHLGGVVEPAARPSVPRVVVGEQVVIAGAGPAGTFAALRLAEAGAHVTILELGKAVQPRRHDLARLVRRGELEPSSNYCFGEGGAGTFSDGKLYTRVKDREAVREVLDVLVAHGADADIRVEGRPHVGSNKLPIILMGLRARLEAMGVEYRWSDPLADLVVVNGRVRAARLSSGDEIACDRLILATGHSARATYEMLVARGVAAEAKPFAVGARVEHPQPLVDAMQYGARAADPRLPAAFYHTTATVADRGVYSFCMCPGGWIVNSSTEPERLATNGMSLKRRDSPYANAALVVTVEPKDFAAELGTGPLAGVQFQRLIEERAFVAGGGGFIAPAQPLADFARGKVSQTLPRTSYRPGIVAGDLGEVLPRFVAEGLRRALPVFERGLRGFGSTDALLVGVETRTSSPVRFVRDASCQSPSHERLYPCGEGAGYAGGIVSAAIDGLRVADAIIASAGGSPPATSSAPR